MDRYRVTSPTSSTIWSIQYLRAIAAIGVVVFHTLTETGHDFEFGATGVDLFFGISGFLMYYVTQGKSIGPLDFLWRRFLRIAPLYWFATLLTVGATFIRPGFFWQASRDVSRVVLSLLFVPQNGIDGGIYPVLYQGWTLQYEAFFYLLFALSLLVPGIWRLIAMTAVIGALTVWGRIAPESHNPVFLTYTDQIALEFVAGAWVGWACARRWPGGLGWRCVYLAALIGGWSLLWAAWWYEDAWDDLSFVATVTAISLILAGSVMLERHHWMPRLRWLRTLGEASYAIYLFQDFGFVGVAGWDAGHPIAVRLVLFSVASLAVGLLAYWGLERPFDRLVRKRSSSAVRSASLKVAVTAP
ncbi:acyltransferase [Sphingomonas bacterium]|uniref:acyltransferase family protein n=1 Tax=Sphingomonas bacterium TaxID=1895847 RepID=UPI00262429F2|nr:acyltransferase [Sphingomonas bacterium]MDB5679941.1 Exopolysaccharide production protein ExoZ [Sphingomonas bacterium]